VRTLRWTLLVVAGSGAGLLLARALTPCTATGTLALERLAEQALTLAAPVAGGLVLGSLSLWRS
jgi:hypothetical protein